METFAVGLSRMIDAGYGSLSRYQYEEQVHPDNHGWQLIQTSRDETYEDCRVLEYQH